MDRRAATCVRPLNPSVWLLAATLLILSGQAFCVESPTTVLFNGKIFTGDPAHPYVHALAIRGESIIATGETATIQALSGTDTRKIDLGGRTVIPGFNDAHQHISVQPSSDLQLETDPASTWDEVQRAISAALKNIAPGRSIIAVIGPAVFRNPQTRRAALDAVSQTIPIFLFSASGHGAVLNSAALKLVHISEKIADPKGGQFERDVNGQLNGVAREYAMWPIWRARQELTGHDEALRQIRELLNINARFGITTVQDMSNEFLPHQIVDLLKESPTSIRVRVIRMPATSPTGRDIAEGASLPLHPFPLVTVSGIKWLLDGTPIETEQAGSLRAGDPPTWATKLTFPSAQMHDMLTESLASNQQLLLHAFGPVAAQTMLQAMEQSGGARVWGSKRVRFEHGDGLTPAMIAQVKALGIVVVQNPPHLVVNQFLPAEQVGPQPLRSLLAAGIPLALGSDGPINPFLGILLASTHPDRPTEAITREQAVAAYTLGSAFAEFAERKKGSLQPGKLADLAILSQDIFAIPQSDLPKTVSILTLVGGKVVYDAGQLH